MADNEEVYETLDGKRLLLHSGETADNSPVLYIGPDQAVLADPDGRSSVMVADEDGVSVQGPLSVQTWPDQWRVAGMWKVNPLITTSLPSTQPPSVISGS